MPRGGGQGGWTDERSAAGKHNPWLIISIISIATFMEVLDTSIANVALQHIAGSLSVSPDESTWVLTSYLVANAIIIPISGWLADVIGRKRYYMISVALFAISSLMCGLAPNLTFLILARIFQGIGGGGLAPSEQSIIADTFPPAKRGLAFAAYGVVVIVAPVAGPTLGGWITDNISWHWVFLINVPVGILSLVLVNFFLCEPKAVEDERAKKLKGGLRVDYIGFALVALGLGCLEVVADRGERDDWFGSPLITSFAIVSALSLVLLVVWELNRRDPIVNLKLLGNRNFAVTVLVMMTTGVILFGSTALIPQMLQQVLGYTATDAGLALTAGGFATVIAMPLAGVAAGKIDTRLVLGTALVVQGIALWNLSHLNAEISFWDAAQARLYQAMALPFLFVPINATAYTGLKPQQVNQASALLNVARNLGGTFGISVSQAMLAERSQFHQSRLVERLNPLNANYQERVAAIGRALGNAGSESVQTLGVLYRSVVRQATMLAYLDVFHVLMWFVFAVVPLTLLLRGGAPKEGGGH